MKDESFIKLICGQRMVADKDHPHAYCCPDPTRCRKKIDIGIINKHCIHVIRISLDARKPQHRELGR